MPTVREVWYDDIIEAPPGYDKSKNPTWSPASVVRSGQLYARLSYKEGEKLNAKLDALLAAQEGLDTAAVLERIDARHDAAAAERAEILALVAAVGSGERDAADVVDEIARRLSGEDA